MPRRAAHCVHSVTRPPASANHADSPVSQSDTGTPAATAVAATVKACEQRSGASIPAVALMTRVRAMPASIGSDAVVTAIGFVSLLVAGFGALAGGLAYLAVRVSRGRL